MYTILVPLDGSPLAEQALPFAERLAAATSARLILSRVLPLSNLQPVEADLASTEEARAYLLLVGDRMTAKGRLLEPTTPWGEPAAEILEQARSAQADLVVMATHGPLGLVAGCMAVSPTRSCATLQFLSSWCRGMRRNRGRLTARPVSSCPWMAPSSLKRLSDRPRSSLRD